MELKDIQDNKELRTKVITIRTYPSYSKWMSKNKVRPSVLFNKAIEELMEKENGTASKTDEAKK